MDKGRSQQQVVTLPALSTMTLLAERITMLIAERVVARYLRTAARPIRLDKAAIKRLVEEQLLPDVRRWLERRVNQEGRIGTFRIPIASALFPLQSVGKGGAITANIGVVVLASESENAVLGGVTLLKTVNEEIEVQLQLNGGLSAGEMLAKRFQTTCSSNKCVSYGLYSVLIHELTHVMDAPYLRGVENVEVDDRGDLRDKAKYYNSPHEFRAFMQQIVDETELWAGRAFPRAKITDGNNRRFVDELLKLSPTWLRVEKIMTASNRRKILTAVYDALSTAGLLLES